MTNILIGNLTAGGRIIREAIIVKLTNRVVWQLMNVTSPAPSIFLEEKITSIKAVILSLHWVSRLSFTDILSVQSLLIVPIQSQLPSPFSSLVWESTAGIIKEKSRTSSNK